MALKLPRLQRTVSMVTPQGTPTITFHIWFDAFGKNIEAAVDGLDTAILDVQATQDALALTQAELTVAVADIATAQSDIVLIQTDVGTITADLSNYVQKDQTAAWATPTGTFTRTTFATYAGQTISATYTPSEVQTTDNRVRDLEQRVAALISDLRGNGVLT